MHPKLKFCRGQKADVLMVLPSENANAQILRSCLLIFVVCPYFNFQAGSSYLEGCKSFSPSTGFSQSADVAGTAHDLES